ncbi:molecular chaperone HtpG [Yunchengibacter salinarum]|uniref:molecular chaperone HtpG n=1 Tax=Yunchengibacter salinarum TaxID=3133399 RepID=UPI0035B68689
MNDTTEKTETGETLGFEAEVSRLLKLMVHSVYSEREIFLRELISNASDACDKLRYAALTEPSLTQDDPDFHINISVDPDARTITVSDNGIGMNKADLKDNLGTIARSGTSSFMDQLTGDAQKDVQLIGQFGVGFYSVFMVADKVQVTTRRAGEDDAWAWESDGEGSYTINPAGKEGRGTDIVLHIKEDADEFLSQHRLEHVIKTYSDHIAVPITLAIKGATDEDGNEKGAERLNDGKALWTRPKSEITEEQYTEFYRHVSHAFDEPAHTIHWKAEGMQEYTVLLFIPSQQPMDLFDPARKGRLKLYVKRIFITEDAGDVLPGWLRFLRGVVDSQDLPLNISREMLQNNPAVTRMSKAITKKVVGELTRLADKDQDSFFKIWEAFGPVIKEGIYEDHERRDQLLELARFKSTKADGWTTLKDYVSRMKDGQKTIYYVTGTDEKTVARSPQLEGFRDKDVEVLLLSDAVDDFWLQMVPDYDDKPLKSITRGASELKDLGDGDKADKKPEDSASEDEMTRLTALMKTVLGDVVADVRPSDRLTKTAACLVADDQAMDMHLERLLKAHNQLDRMSAKILEVNPANPLIRKLAARAADDNAANTLTDPVHLVLDQARILEGDPPADPTAFAERLSRAMEQGLA